MSVVREHVLLVDPVIRRIFFIWIAVRVLFIQDAPDPNIDREGVDVVQPEKRDAICNFCAHAKQLRQCVNCGNFVCSQETQEVNVPIRNCFCGRVHIFAPVPQFTGFQVVFRKCRQCSGLAASAAGSGNA